jgi:hypothetical protein
MPRQFYVGDVEPVGIVRLCLDCTGAFFSGASGYDDAKLDAPKA